MTAQLAEAVAHAQAVASGTGAGSLRRFAKAGLLYEQALAANQSRDIAFVAALGVLRDAEAGRSAAGRRGPGRAPVPESARVMVRAIAMMAEVSLAVFIGPRRNQHIVRWRWLACYVLHKHGYSYPVVGAALGGRDHATVIHGVRRFEELLPGDPEMQGLVEKLVVEVEERAVAA